MHIYSFPESSIADFEKNHEEKQYENRLRIRCVGFGEEYLMQG